MCHSSATNIHKFGQEPLIPVTHRADCLKLGRDSDASRDETALSAIVQWMSPLVRRVAAASARAKPIHVSVLVGRWKDCRSRTMLFWSIFLRFFADSRCDLSTVGLFFIVAPYT